MAILLSGGICYGAGTTGANFLKIPSAPIPAGMGEAYTAISGPDSILYNPAGLGLMNYSAFSAAHNEYIAGLKQEYAACAVRTDAGTFGIAFSILSSGNFDAYGVTGAKTGTTSSSHMLGVLSYSQSFPHWDKDKGMQDPHLMLTGWSRIPDVERYRRSDVHVSVGASFKYISERLDDTSTSGTTADVGVVIVPAKRFNIGISALNITGAQDFGGGAFSLPRTYRAGAAADFVSIKRLFVLRMSSDYVKEKDINGYGCVGIEMTVLQAVSIRSGMRINRSLGNGMSLGAGFALDSLGDENQDFLSNLRIDYVWSDEGDFGSSQKLGLQILL